VELQCKGPADGVGAAVKRLADGFILAGKATQNAADLVHLISESNSTVSVFHIEKLDVNLPENVPVFPGTMKIHQILIRGCAVKYREFSCYCRENDFCECYEWKCVHYSGPHEEAARAPEDSGGDELPETHEDGAVAAQSQAFSELDTLVNCDPVASFVEEYISPTPFKDNVGGVVGAAGAFRFVDFSQNCARRFGLNFHHR